MDRYSYSPLENATKQIRLLKIRPSTNVEDQIAYDMQLFSVDSAPTYQAISYTWGPQQPQRLIVVNDHSMWIRKNCAYALSQAAREYQENWLWVDSICINQEDLEEKASQVAMMGDIFECATTVLASIGEATASSRLFLQAAEKLHSFWQAHAKPGETSSNIKGKQWRFRLLSETTITAARQMLCSMQPRDFCRLWNAYSDFSDRPYWSRAWIVQEITLARKVVILCGEMRLNFTTLDSFCYFITQAQKRGNRINAIAKEVGIEDEGDIEETRIQWLCQRQVRGGFNALDRDMWIAIGDLMCFDPRDRIYGLLKLFGWSNSEGSGPPLRPDYTKSPVGLALDVISQAVRQKVGRGKMTLEELHALLRALEISKSHAEAGLRELPKVSDWTPQREYCICLSPSAPRVPIEMGSNSTAHAYIHAYKPDDKDEQLCASILAEKTPSQHTELKIETTGEHFIAVAKGRNGRTVLEIKTALPLQSGDVMVWLEPHARFASNTSSQNRPWQRRRNCLLLRKAGINEYYQIVSRATIDGSSRFCDAANRCSDPRLSSPCKGPESYFSLYLDAKDILDYILSPLGKTTTTQQDSCTYSASNSISIPFCRQTFSSYAIKASTPLKRVYGVPTVDGKSAPCAVCGGLFTFDLTAPMTEPP